MVAIGNGSSIHNHSGVHLERTSGLNGRISGFY